MNRIALDAFDRAEPKLECRAKDAFGLLQQRVEEERLRRILDANPSLRSIYPRIACRRRRELQPQPGEPMPLQNRGFKIASGDAHGIDPVREDSMKMRRGIEHTKRFVVHHNEP